MDTWPVAAQNNVCPISKYSKSLLSSPYINKLICFSKLTPICATEDMDETQLTHVIKCPPNHTLVSRVHWIICQVNELTKCL